jgi:hypothetical protein
MRVPARTEFLPEELDSMTERRVGDVQHGRNT